MARITSGFRIYIAQNFIDKVAIKSINDMDKAKL